uniref:Smr domain-containing protein n=1 Tax=Noccaea caerulescens TaxID=107243 RepID=A0A1J3F6A3_NOCCA
MRDDRILRASANTKMSWMKGKSSGWTAFDLKERQKQGLKSTIEDDPFPPVSSSGNASLDVRGKLRRNHEPSSEKSFSSVLIPPPKFPALTENNAYGKNQVCGGGRRSRPSTLIPPVNSHDLAFMKLKEMFSWADDSLIRDILLSTEDHFEMALDFLKGMVSAGDSVPDEGNNNKEADDPNSTRSECKTFGRTVTSSAKMAARSTCVDGGKYGLQERGGSSFLANAYESEKLSDDISELDSIIQRLHSIPIEPEWEEDDLYLIHRKDALKMMRSASNHSRAAQNAFLRYDHASAKQHSEKAREDWSTAEKLNAEAAKKILGITNRNNDIWKLDLHGLHAGEAVQVLQERLQKIEGQFTVNRSVSPNRGRLKNVALRSASQEPCGRLDVEGLDRQRTTRELRNSLQVVTGIGKHSRGHASLPVAVKTFFEDNRYRIDETRPGVITVRPKFRHS